MPKKAIHTTLSEDAIKLLDKYTALKKENGELVYGNQSKVIEVALDLLDKHHNPSREDLQSIANRARSELNMLLVGKATFLAYISGNFEKAFTHNVATDILEWYTQKHIDQMTCREILEGLKTIWMAANYFYKVEIEEKDGGVFEVSYYHDLHELRYSEFWGKYFATFIERHHPCRVEILPRNSYFRLNIIPK
ncbi:MAG: hypothetical protein RBG13Loki_1761 [Promethearchaeota archaeon CR_4]|nr:MAG: hypothetical protein RBG13Loki_1761 [Candidatus Lokiarchaeota archaeon CR_4]